jgi:hypothetical protein
MTYIEDYELKILISKMIPLILLLCPGTMLLNYC